MSMKNINKHLRKLCGDNIDEVKFSKHLSRGKEKTIKLINDYIEKGEMLKLHYPTSNTGWHIHISAFDRVFRDLNKIKKENPDEYASMRIKIQIAKFENEKIKISELSDNQHDDLMWDGVMYKVMRVIDGDEPDPRKELN